MSFCFGGTSESTSRALWSLKKLRDFTTWNRCTPVDFCTLRFGGSPMWDQEGGFRGFPWPWRDRILKYS